MAAALQRREGPLAGGPIAEESSENRVIVAPEQADCKTLATLKAQFALRGHSVYELADGGFLVTRWGLSRACPDLHALGQFARQIGATA